MRAKEGVLERLNALLTNDLTAINQYFLQAEICRHWGYERLYHKLREFSIHEMRDAERLVRHILYLEGIPNMQRLVQNQATCSGMDRCGSWAHPK